MVTCMTPGSAQREDRYNAIKKLCIADLGLISQVVRCKTLEGPKMRSVCINIALQVTCKLGGQLWAVQIPYKQCIIFGVDVFHHPTRKNLSVIGIVASLNVQCTTWYSQSFFQDKHEEITNTLRTGISNALKKFYEVNKFMPNQIFVYRDGVGDGQLPVVRHHEVPQVEQAVELYARYYKDSRPSVTYIVVQKRINVKVLVMKEGQVSNPPPGTVLDHTVTKSNYNDFFLISQHVTQVKRGLFSILPYFRD